MCHSMFGEPFSVQLSGMVGPVVREILAKEGVKLHEDKTVVCMEGESDDHHGIIDLDSLFAGPAFSTRAESLMYRQWGGDIINMSVIPEAKLAREAELE